ncbi:MAG: PadR family transcriptional regulator [Chloroflexi bacterium]|nr:PadR family transcriptional regulator [Chloroflexota bacterium]
MRDFPWSWRREGDAWEPRLRRGGPGGPGGPRFGPEDRPRPDQPSGPPPPPPPPSGGWPFGGQRGRGFRGGPFGPGGPFGAGGPFGGPEFWEQFGPGRRGGRRGGGGGWGPFGPPFGRGPKVRRGDVRAAVLALLAEQPRNGYQIIQEIAERSGGLWKPSSGSVYPALQLLTDEGLVEEATEDGRRSFRLTEAGRAYVEAHKDEVAAPWETMKADFIDSSTELFPLLGQVAMAVVQVSQAATPTQLKQARQVLADARRGLYQILAEGEGEAVSEAEAAGEGPAEDVPPTQV